MLKIKEECINSVLHQVEYYPDDFLLNNNNDPIIDTFISKLINITYQTLAQPELQNRIIETAVIIGATGMYHLIRTQIESNELE